QKINHTLKKLLPPNRFVTATIAYISPENHMIEIWNGSNPTPMFFDEHGKVLKVFEKANFALGIVDNDILDSRTEVYVWPEKGELLVFTDGIVDLRDAQGNLYGIQGMIEAMSHLAAVNRTDQIGFDLVIEHASDYARTGERGDDISLISIECN
ncbi:MAG TPA: serine/threonine-protein phosphatase, partial [Gammaproteobacteria bacterium]|nr:serine/threonine-protein phosphatase [Gammaproteobacteria bacterium]